MKNTVKIFSSILFVVYISFVFRIVFPLIDYTINYKYITEELCIERDNPDNNCHGSCYLSSEIEREVNPSSEEKTVVLDFVKIPLLVFSFNNNYFPKTLSIKYLSIQSNILKNSPKPITPPPQIAFC